MKILDSNLVTVVLLIAFIVGSILVLNHAFLSTMDGIEWTEETYIVRSGDSLWSISCEYCPDGVDCREWIEEIRALNGMDDSMIHPGQTLIILAAKEG